MFIFGFGGLYNNLKEKSLMSYEQNNYHLNFMFIVPTYFIFIKYQRNSDFMLKIKASRNAIKNKKIKIS